MGSVPLVRVVSTIFVRPSAACARNWIMCPDESGSAGEYEGAFALSYPVVRSTTRVIARPAMCVG